MAIFPLGGIRKAASLLQKVELKASLAPLGVVLGLDNTDGVIGPGLDHLGHRENCFFLLVVFQNFIIIITCN